MKKLFLIFFLLTFQAWSQTVDPELKFRVQGYVDTMLQGSDAAIVEKQDYYQVVYLATEGKVTQVKALDQNKFEATLVFKVQGQILQDGEKTPPTKKEKKKAETVTTKVRFSVEKTGLQWSSALASPFVRADKKIRYLIVK